MIFPHKRLTNCALVCQVARKLPSTDLIGKLFWVNKLFQTFYQISSSKPTPLVPFQSNPLFLSRITTVLLEAFVPLILTSCFFLLIYKLLMNINLARITFNQLSSLLVSALKCPQKQFVQHFSSRLQFSQLWKLFFHHFF